MIEVKAADGDADGDLYIWKWLLELILKYGSDGMSSDDTDTNSTGTRYRVKILVWRRHLDSYVQMIDNERKLSKDVFPAAGANFTNRLQSAENLKSERQAPCGLPVALFDTDWLEEVNDDYHQLVLNVSKEDFLWIKFQPEQREEGTML